ncbi:MAG TPA: hypothetical protein VF771_08205 [Longimicrobiaceae bacterium]
MRRWCAAVAGALVMVTAACQRPTPSVAGRWQRVDQPSEWIEFGADGSWRSRSFTGTQVAGTYRQTGRKVTMTVVPQGHGGTLTLTDSLLVMEEGTRYRRARP